MMFLNFFHLNQENDQDGAHALPEPSAPIETNQATPVIDPILSRAVSTKEVLVVHTA